MSVDRSFLDTNIFIYAGDEADPTKARRSRKLIADVVNNGNGVSSYQVIQEFVNVVLRRFRKTLLMEDVERFLATVFQPLVIIHSSFALYAEALRIQNRYRLSWYDALIVAAAVEADCRILYSEDLQHGQRFESTTVRNPFL
jgi:predicted nucleic acid-binding protein